jgi:hypothetical protein
VAEVGLEVTGLDAAVTELGTMAERVTAAVVAAMVTQGGQMVSTAYGIAPKASGAMASALSITPTKFSKGEGVKLSAGSDKVPYAYTFHAGMVGKPTVGVTGLPTAPKVSGGMMVFRVNGYTRTRTGRSGKGGFVGGYSALRKIKLNPYLYLGVVQGFARFQSAVELAAREASD